MILKYTRIIAFITAWYLIASLVSCSSIETSYREVNCLATRLPMCEKPLKKELFLCRMKTVNYCRNQ